MAGKQASEQASKQASAYACSVRASQHTARPHKWVVVVIIVVVVDVRGLLLHGWMDGCGVVNEWMDG